MGEQKLNLKEEIRKVLRENGLEVSKKGVCKIGLVSRDCRARICVRNVQSICLNVLKFKMGFPVSHLYYCSALHSIIIFM